LRLYNMPLAARNQNNRQDANALRADSNAGTAGSGCGGGWFFRTRARMSSRLLIA
jgi:hypothetical protein